MSVNVWIINGSLSIKKNWAWVSKELSNDLLVELCHIQMCEVLPIARTQECTNESGGNCKRLKTHT
jgi:hypothetical protein